MYQIIGEVLQPFRNKILKTLKINVSSIGFRIIRICLTFALVDFAWIFFRADNFSYACEIISSMKNVRNPWVVFSNSLFLCGLDAPNFQLCIYGILILLFADICKKHDIKLRKIIMAQDRWFRCLFIAGCVLLILVFGKYGPSFDSANFIYFQF